MNITYRIPEIEDGAKFWKMVDDSAALDANSSYAYFMICRNFSAFSVVAEVDGEVAGMVTAYPLPQDNRRLFVWQVNVKEKFQGQGIAKGMLEEILLREECINIQYIETTIAPNNVASKTLFERLADQFNTKIKQTEVYKDELFPDADHQIENLYIIGPIGLKDNFVYLMKEDNGYKLYVSSFGNKAPALEPINPVFNFDDGLRAAEQLKSYYKACEIVICGGDDLLPCWYMNRE